MFVLLFVANLVVLGSWSSARAADSADCALAALAFGDRARHFSRLLVKSFEKNALQDSPCPLYLFTDNQTALRQATLSVAAEPRVQVIELHETPDGLPLVEPKENSAAGRRGRRPPGPRPNGPVSGKGLADNVHMRVKLLKPHLFDYLPDSIQLVVYLDSDIVIGRSLRPLVQRCRQQYRDRPDTALALYPDIGMSKAPYHTGVMCMSRLLSEPLLRSWARRIGSGRFKRDQWALKHAVDRAGLRHSVALLPVTPFHFTFVNGTVFSGTQPYTLIHATMYRLSDPARWQFSVDQARHYYTNVLSVPFEYDFLFDEIKNKANKSGQKKRV